jgi:hypothetical protein
MSIDFYVPPTQQEKACSGLPSVAISVSGHFACKLHGAVFRHFFLWSIWRHLVGRREWQIMRFPLGSNANPFYGWNNDTTTVRSIY